MQACKSNTVSSRVGSRHVSTLLLFGEDRFAVAEMELVVRGSISVLLQMLSSAMRLHPNSNVNNNLHHHHHHQQQQQQQQYLQQENDSKVERRANEESMSNDAIGLIGAGYVEMCLAKHLREKVLSLLRRLLAPLLLRFLLVSSLSNTYLARLRATSCSATIVNHRSCRCSPLARRSSSDKLSWRSQGRSRLWRSRCCSDRKKWISRSNECQRCSTHSK